MSEFGDAGYAHAIDPRERVETSCRDLLRAATHEPHERLHRHHGFSIVKDGTITLPAYRALIIRLYGFYVPFERAISGDKNRTRWLERDLMALNVDPLAVSRIALCIDLPPLDSFERRLGALYVVEGSALGGRQLSRGLDPLLGAETADGRRFFTGRGEGTGAAWLGFLEQLASVGHEPGARAALISAAIETFDAFERWLGGWSD